MKIFIVEDELNNILGLKNLIDLFYPNAEVIGHAQRVLDAVNQINSLLPDCVLMDIQLPDGTGFDVIQQIENKQIKIIFTTAYDQYAIKAFKFSALDYLLKPIDKDELITALNKIKGENKHAKQNQFYSNSGKLPLPTMQGVMIVDIEKVVRCEASDNYSKVFLIDGKDYLVSKTLQLLEDFLSDYGFLRSHRSHLINPKYVTFLEKGKSAIITMQNGHQVPWSDGYRKPIADAFGQL